MSDSREARPGAPRPPKAAAPKPPALPRAPLAPRPPAPSSAQSPRPPAVRAPRTSQTTAKAGPVPQHPSEPPESGWDEPIEVEPAAASPPDGAARAPAASELPEAARASSGASEVSAARVASPSPSPPPAAELTPELETKIAELVRAAVAEALAPFADKQRELEARLDALARASAPVHAPARVEPEAPAAGPPPVVKSTSYGPVSIPPPGAPRPSIEAELAKVPPFEVPNFGGRRRIIGRLLIGFLLACVVSAILATILSHV